MTGQELRIAPLGGFGEIGANCMAIEAAERILVVDCGVMFPWPGLAGVELIHPSFEYLIARRDRLEAVVLTHGHEDHAAAVPYLLREIDLPVYGSGYTLGLVRGRAREAGIRVDARRLDPGGRLDLGPFSVETFPMPHSIAHNMGLAIRTPAGRVLHTGDFKLDLDGPDRGRAALGALGAAAADGVDVMVCDSTGAEELNPSGAEADVAEDLAEIVAAEAGRVFVAIFSSNSERLGSVLDAARAAGRRVALCGRSVESHCRIAVETGALSPPPGLIATPEEIMDLPPSRGLLVVAGTQGESRSALGRLSRGSHAHARISAGDLVVLSSRFIPGNEIAIAGLIDRLIGLGARVIHRSIRPGVHASGHGSRREIVKAVEAVRPRAFLPAHGTLRHMAAAAEIAREAGVPHVTVARDGQVVTWDGDGLSAGDPEVWARKVYIDGGAGLSDDAMRDRRLLAAHGVLVAAWTADREGMPDGSVEIAQAGVVAEESSRWLRERVAHRVRAALGGMDPSTRADNAACRAAVRASLRRFLARDLGREPFVMVSIL